MAEYPAAGDKPASRHDDLMIIYPEGKDLRADYYDSEGHVIRYQVATTTDHSAVLTSDVVSGAPRYRLSYSLTPTKELEGKFEIAPPGKSEEFRQYLSWTSRRVPAEG